MVGKVRGHCLNIDSDYLIILDSRLNIVLERLKGEWLGGE